MKCKNYLNENRKNSWMNYLKKHLLKIVHFKLAFPVVLGMITTMIYNLADTMFVAKTGNTDLAVVV